MVINVGDPCPWTFLKNFKKKPCHEFGMLFSTEIFFEM
jgi:hypothetical protein